MLIFYLLALFGSLEAKQAPVEIALTFDDFPMGKSLLFEKKERTQVYVDTLAQLNIQTVFFCIGEQLVLDEDKECALLVADHLLANHSFKHLHLSELSLEEFVEEIEKTEALLSCYPNFRKWFRFPYLDYGDRSSIGGSDRKRCAAFLFLKHSGYQHGYITINTFDWYVDGLLKKAIKEGWQIHWDLLKSAYLSLLEEWIDIYHERWSHVLQKKFVHVLLFHQNDINALFLPDIVQLIHQKGWVIVSPEKAFNTPIPYLSHFANTKKGLFKGVKSLSTAYIDQVFESYNVFDSTLSLKEAL